MTTVDTKPTVITAAEWGTVAEDVKAGRCVVWADVGDGIVAITDIKHVGNDRYIVTDIQGTPFETFKDREFTVRPQPSASPTAEYCDKHGVEMIEEGGNVGCYCPECLKDEEKEIGKRNTVKPPSASPLASSPVPAEDEKPFQVITTFDYNYLKQCEAVVGACRAKELEDRKQLESQQTELRRLRELAGRAADAIDIEEYDSPENVALVNELREAAKGKGE